LNARPAAGIGPGDGQDAWESFHGLSPKKANVAYRLYHPHATLARKTYSRG